MNGCLNLGVTVYKRCLLKRGKGHNHNLHRINISKQWRLKFKSYSISEMPYKKRNVSKSYFAYLACHNIFNHSKQKFKSKIIHSGE